MFKPFQQFLEKELFGRFDLQSRPIPSGLESLVSERGKNPATIQSWCYECPELRKIRYTYIDAGETAQIFNSVIYPNYNYDLPLLGIDFLAFGQKKILVVLDFQPLFREQDYLDKYIEPMSAIRDKYKDLAQDLEMKFYDANQYFSKNLLFAKTDAETVIKRLFPAYQEYVQLYWQLIEQASPVTTIEASQRIIKAQKDYDQYSAERDPASGLFSSYFGHEWSERFLYEFLFEDAIPLAVTAGVK
ncbi:15,16-dihydrobiliverdin:ferredoxin oxidoreductase [Aphanothece sacrum]|uniref:15,16-dihydrobiliverdin:ferredoxin oxidoreductase n=1 Tax=Aphanothece sacrum FPU1 TaxID=1920663 RepID=A0A401IK26_APHSA|nr:15,16-dihydrobiliverdin:ferredoxin oxidoreductase [Aphanothece sacrum]GBF81652.1 15,16-dihydrobiliverdin:ferredoxin oxidoreductase [Aphanothece sacrum FPU1]GBF84089.1 15,16-dihydrobiliverdin:ferredoxin oxidoreductase [Aphanothece sacrum FPU3]